MEYKPTSFEKNWIDYWEANKVYQVFENNELPKYYVLDMFPYPSGAGLHVGHPLGYIASDIFTRYKRLKGFNVLHPMGFDAFGLPAEEYALQTGIHPGISTNDNMNRYRQQLKDLGFSFDWDREVYTCDPNYYKWTQWIFTELFNHFYDNALQKARPINELIEEFETNGNMLIDAATTHTELFEANFWNTMSVVDQSDILMNYRLAYRKIGYVNWCEELGTVLANDQVKDGVSERGGYPVIQKPMKQWYLRITAYADRLLEGLEKIQWSEALKTMQRNWIGRSEGASISFNIVGSEKTIEVFTTRPDTIFGATYMVLAPLHDLVSELTTIECKAEVDHYISYVKSKSEIERMAEKEVTGCFTGAYAINPLTNEEIPIWIGEYVLKDYGTGAIMAVPSDDERDNIFARKFNLKIIDVIDKSKYPGAGLHDKLGILINSGFINGMEVPNAITAVCRKVEEMQIGKALVNFKMRDANFSRQRYWGEPFPVEYDKNGLAQAMPLDRLPLVLPETEDFKPGRDGRSPLSRIPEWTHQENGFTRETDVMPAVAGSSWYYLRYMDPHNDEEFANADKLNYWESVDLYIGGAEHAVAHLMYARFWHKFLYDKNRVPTDEPFKKLVNQGMIQGIIEFIFLDKTFDGPHQRLVSLDLAQKEKDKDFSKIPVHVDFVTNYGSSGSFLDKKGIQKFITWRPEYKNAIFESTSGKFQLGEINFNSSQTSFKMETLSEVGKMSKSKFNVINPDDVINKYGRDCFRMFEMFLGPIEQAKPWDIKGIDGVYKFLKKFWSLYFDANGDFYMSNVEPNSAELKILHKTIKKVSEDIEKLSFNTAVSAFMICVNELKRQETSSQTILVPLLRMLSPFAPFCTEELWKKMGHSQSIHLSSFPDFDASFVVEEQIEYPICFNGKKRAIEKFSADATQDEIKQRVLELDVTKKWTNGKQIRKLIIVPGRMVNVVVS